MKNDPMILNTPSQAEINAMILKARKERSLAAHKFLRTAFASLALKKQGQSDCLTSQAVAAS